MILHWDTQNACEFDLKDTLCVLNVGSTEQHSDYLPLGTDNFIGESITKQAAMESGFKVMIMPSQRVGFSAHHRNFAGCITISQRVLQEYLFELFYCAVANGAQKIMIVNAHGGNQACLQAVVNDLGRELGVKAVLVRYWDLIAEHIKELRQSQPGGMGHAGELETSLMMFLLPHLVDKSAIGERPAAEGSPWHHPDMFSNNKIYIYKPFDEYSPKGNVGQPIFADEEKGEKIFRLAVNELKSLMQWQMSNEI